jgi:hypothetical protein
MDELESIRALLAKPGAPARVHAETSIAMSTLYRIRQQGMQPRYDTLQRLREYCERQSEEASA